MACLDMQTKAVAPPSVWRGGVSRAIHSVYWSLKWRGNEGCRLWHFPSPNPILLPVGELALNSSSRKQELDLPNAVQQSQSLVYSMLHHCSLHQKLPGSATMLAVLSYAVFPECNKLKKKLVYD